MPTMNSAFPIRSLERDDKPLNAVPSRRLVIND